MSRAAWLSGGAFVGGAAVWLFVSLVSGRREAWDSGLYFLVGLPAVCLLSLALSFLEPRRWWLFGVLPVIGEFVALLAQTGGGNLLPLGILAFGVLSVPSVVAAGIGGLLGRRKAALTPPPRPGAGSG